MNHQMIFLVDLGTAEVTNLAVDKLDFDAQQIPTSRERAPNTPDKSMVAARWHLPLTVSMLRSLREAAFAEDVPIDPDTMCQLTPEEAAAYFERGGPPAGSDFRVERPPPEPCAVDENDEKLSSLCDSLADSRQTMRLCVGCRSFDEWLTFLDGASRPALLAELKRLGVANLGARQAFANALMRHARAVAVEAATAAAAESAAASIDSAGASSSADEAFNAAALAVTVGGGLCNRLRVALSYLWVARLERRPLLVVWARDAECPASFAESGFEVPEGARFVDSCPAGVHAVMPPPSADFHPRVKGSSAEVDMYASLVPTPELRAAVVRKVAALTPCFGAVHVRRTDHWHGTSDDEFVSFMAALPGGDDGGMRAYVATDNARTQAVFRKALGERLRACCTAFGGGSMASSLRHTSVLNASIDLLTCAAADGPFKGSYQSSFSDTIGRLRRLHGRVHAADDHRFADISGEPNLRSFAVPF